MITCVRAPVAPFTCGATVWYEKIFGVRAVGGLPEPLGGGGLGGVGDDGEVAGDCGKPDELFDGELAPCAAEELSEVETELAVDVWANA